MATEMEGKGQVEEIMVTTTVKMVEGSTNGGVVVEAHPYAFHVSGPRNLSSPNWRDIISYSCTSPSPFRKPISQFPRPFPDLRPLLLHSGKAATGNSPPGRQVVCTVQAAGVVQHSAILCRCRESSPAPIIFLIELST
ncbi:unnamed protein product [Amaranthus hypochondriacus]